MYSRSFSAPLLRLMKAREYMHLKWFKEGKQVRQMKTLTGAEIVIECLKEQGELLPGRASPILLFTVSLPALSCLEPLHARTPDRGERGVGAAVGESVREGAVRAQVPPEPDRQLLGTGYVEVNAAVVGVGRPVQPDAVSGGDRVAVGKRPARGVGADLRVPLVVPPVTP